VLMGTHRPASLLLQGMGFAAVTLAWVAGDLPRALALHFRDGTGGVSDLDNFGRQSLGLVQDGTSRDWFVCLNQIRLLVLGLHQAAPGLRPDPGRIGVLVADLATGLEKDYDPDAFYPRNLVLKWLACAVLLAGSLPVALKDNLAGILERTTAAPRGLPLLEMMRQGERIVLAALNRDRGVAADPGEALAALRALAPAAWVRVPPGLEKMAPPELALEASRILPFYYS